MGAIHLSTAFLETDLSGCHNHNMTASLRASSSNSTLEATTNAQPQSANARSVGAEDRLGWAPMYHQTLQCQHTGQRPEGAKALRAAEFYQDNEVITMLTSRSTSGFCLCLSVSGMGLPAITLSFG